MKITCSKKATLVLFLAIFCTYFQSSFAQSNSEDTASPRCHHLVIIDHDPTGLTFQFDGDEYIPVLGEDCEYTKNIAINIMGEGIFGNQLSDGNDQTNVRDEDTSNIPGHPPLYIELRVGDADPVYIEAGYFFWSETANCIGEVFTSFVPITLDFSEVCGAQELPPDQTSVDILSRSDCESGQFASIDYNVRLVTPDGADGYVDYPVGLFTDEGEIFDCQAFDETGECCSSDNDCLSFAVNSTHTVKACCGACGGSVIYTPGPFPKEDPPVARNQSPIGSLVAPNPFMATLNIQFTNDSKDPVNIDILDLNGKVIQSVPRRSMKKGELVKVDAEKLSSGIYYVRIHSTKGVETHKVIKM